MDDSGSKCRHRRDPRRRPADIVVCDSHGNGQSVLIDRLPDDVRIVRGFPRPLEMMQGIDDTFAAAMFVGYHASEWTANAVRATRFPARGSWA